MPTPHINAQCINAQCGDFAPIVLMPGDPLRAQFIAENYLQSARKVSDVRGMLGFTGYYQQHRISVMGHGMGIPSAAIYVHELITQYHVHTVIRVGSCGAIQKELALMDVVIAMGAGTDSNVNRMRFGGYDFAAIADYSLLETTMHTARTQKTSVQVGNIFTSDFFYHPDPNLLATLKSMGILAVDMETAGIYGVAASLGARALALLSVSDHLITGEQISAKQRQTAFDAMITLALKTAIAASR